MLILILLMCFGCSKPQPVEPPDVDDGPDIVLNEMVEISLRDTLQLFYDNKTFALFIHYDGCPWCAEAMPLFEAVTALYPYTAYDLNFTKVYKEEADTYKVDYDILQKIVDEVLIEEDGEKVLYVPEVIFVKNGKIVYDHCSTVETHDPYEAPMNSDEINELLDYYEEGYELMK